MKINIKRSHALGQANVFGAFHWHTLLVSHLSGEQVELFPVDMLVSMLSELSRLSVSYAGPPAGGAGWCRMEWCTTGAAGVENGPFNWEWEPCGTSQWHCRSISSLGFSSVVKNLESPHVWGPRQIRHIFTSNLYRFFFNFYQLHTRTTFIS